MHPKTNKFPSCVLANTGGRMALRWFCWERCKAAPTILNIVKNALGLLPRAKMSSAVPPVFRAWLCTLSVLIYCVPVTWNWRWSLLGMSVQVLWIRRDMRFGSLLGGYFHNSFTKARTDRFLSVLPGGVYSSLSWHLADMGIFIVRIGWTNVFLGYIIHLERGNCQPGFG